MAIRRSRPSRPAPQPTSSADITVHFNAPLPNTAITNLSFGSCISTFAGDGQGVNIIQGGAAGTAWKNKLAELGPLVWRIPLWYNSGNPGSSAAFARSSGDADDYVVAIKSISGIPMIAVGGTTGDNDIVAADAANLVSFFNTGGGQNGGPVDYWIIGNEPDNSGGFAAYRDAFNGIASAMRAATSRTLYLAGPTFVEYATYKQGDFNSFLDTCGAQLDRLDFHKYGSGDGIAGDLAVANEYYDGVTWCQGAIQARGATQNRVKVQVGEFNYHSGYDAGTYGADAFWTSRNTVHTAAAIGHTLNAGGAAYHYSDNNGPLGLISPGNGTNGAPNGQRIPMPAFHGMKMWTGGNLFRRPTGSMATVLGAVPGVDVFASTGLKNVVLINKELTAKSLQLQVQPGPYAVWQTTPGLNPTDYSGPQFANPTRTTLSSTNTGVVPVRLPAMSVTTVLVG